MGGVGIGTTVTTSTAGTIQMPNVGPEIAGDSPPDAGVTIAVEARVARNFSAGIGITAV